MLLKGFLKVETFLPPCRPGEIEKLSLIAELSEDIGQAFPYLNSVLRGTVYDPENQILSFKLGGRGVTLYPTKIFVAGLESREEAEEFLGRLKDLINETYERRDELKPSYKTRSKLTALDIYKLLPRTNCHECGEPTCMAFAAKLVLGDTSVEKCAPLFAENYEEEREKLFKLLETAGYVE